MTAALASGTRALVPELLGRLAKYVGLLADRPIELGGVRAEVARARAAGPGTIHVSFKLGFEVPGGYRFGCLLLPLPDALSVGGYLMVLPDEAVGAYRERTTLDQGMKDALLELGNFVARAFDEVLREKGMTHLSVHSEGCQGVRPDVRPCFPYEEGGELVVARARARVNEFPPFELILMLPPLPSEG